MAKGQENPRGSRENPTQRNSLSKAGLTEPRAQRSGDTLCLFAPTLPGYFFSFSDTMNLIADVYERELDKQVQVVSTLIPPMVMVVIAAVIGVVIYGILVAVFNLTSGIKTH